MIANFKKYFLQKISLFFLVGRNLLDKLKLKFFSDTEFLYSQGYVKLQKDYFLSQPNLSAMEDALIALLDQIASTASETHSESYFVERINEDQFYSLKLGPRLRLTYRINDFENWPALAQALIKSRAYTELLQKFSKTTEGVFKCYIEKTYCGGSEPQWHVDSNSQVGRMIYLLSDVNSDDGPLEYLAGSHLDSAAKYDSIKMRQLLNAESWTPFAVYRNEANLHFFTGNRGESYFFDGRGVHRATLSKTRNRYSVMISFTPNGFLNRLLDLHRGGWPRGVRHLKLF
jgi:hypothetical protein